MKRLIVTLLTVCMVVGMFAGLSVTAFADYDTSDMVAYTMTAGDNVYNVCQKMGISFWDYENVIKTVNNIKSYSNISVGAVIYFPKPGASATLPAGTGAAAGSTSTAGSTTPKTDSFEVKSDDKIAYYLVPHVMQTGEQIKDLCAAYGVDYYSYSAKIAKMNGLASCDNVRAGATVLIPSISAPSGECYRVIAHTVQPGDAVYNKCIEYGVDYYSNLTVLKGVNNTDNLNNIQAGNTLYIPVAGTANGSAGAGTGTGTGTGTGSTTPATGVVYNITIAAAANGKVSANVNGAAVVKAAAGEKVEIIPSADKGYALESFSVTATAGGAAVLSTDEGFTMPAYAVTVTAKFKEASSYKAEAKPAEHGVIKLQPAGGTAAQSQKIAEGTKVTVVATADNGYTLDAASIKVYNPNNTAKTVAVNGNAFVMPSHPVAVEAKFVSSETYKCFVSDDAVNGSYWIEVDGEKVDEVNKGKTVKVCVEPKTGYEIKNIYYYQTVKEANKTALGTVQSFKMPGYDTTVVVKFQKASAHAVGIDTTGFPTGCTLTSNVTTASYGETVSLTATAAENYKLDKITVTDANGAEVPVSADNTFSMPSTDVVVVATFAEGKYNVTLNVGANGTAKMSINGTESKKNPDKGIAGKLVRIDVEPKLGYEAKVVATNANGNKEVTVKQSSSEGYFYITMPEHAVVINVSFNLPTKTVYGPNFDSTKGTVSLLKDGEKLDPQKAGKGDIVTISVEPAPGVAVKSVTVDDGAGNATAIVNKVNDSTYTFKMPDVDVAVNVEFADPVKYAISLGTITNGTVSFVSDGYPVTEAGKGAKVQMTVTPADGYKLKSIQVTKAGDPSTALPISSNSFTMPGFAVEVTATFEPTESSTATYKIEKKYCYNGEYQVLAKSGDNQDTLKFAKGKTVYVKLKPNNGYVLDDIAITYNDGASRVPFTGSGSLYSFEMIDSNVSIRVTYKKG